MTRIYIEGWKKCMKCDVITELVRCPKCNRLTRWKPRSLKAETRDRLYKIKRY